MKKRLATAAMLLFTALPLAGAAADEAVIYGSSSAVRMLAPYAGLMQAKAGVTLGTSNHGTGQLVLDVIDGKSQAAAISMPLAQAVAAAREAAWSEGRMIKVPDSLQFHEVASLRNGDVAVGFVTAGEPAGAVGKVIAELR